ncbi:MULTISPECIES: LLM class flavin-dependent oxidoreductase [Micromonospora]|uniref:5,10-methylene tetrahydromethanopterin reductase n=1 Tax=Micromonospora maris TaxID=1003110 RepID=A0A9X0I0U2_9ACTN|nr:MULTISPECIES: LLM class flavin-dependent oxidoreductase [Micromonospora]AEB45302.1 putative F420-dependent oxidoreductase [Micromonospora maris AB-18-032]KUJ44700.1 5,10-methylene tetrahydromethanopterin reductase [Micromonospora maris]RUL95265.1 LLM class flavin-dependent oxidoreductase [Verrucosispora sp. FIM060022]
MSDYGHDLIFGSFLTPGSADATQPVRLAMLSEQVGLDLVTFQDHPYQPAYLDTWTLMSFVAARTSRVRLAANVTNLPLRPPAVLARSIASLDLLSGGRTELGLGAGGFWDAIESMGGRRLSPGQAVRALEEAIEIIRQVWDAGARGGVRVDGEFHRVIGAKRGPAPAHDVPVWIGAYKPRMQALTGRLADGWLPSLPYLQPGDLAKGNAVIDEAATAAGRSPTDVRRLLNISGRFTATGSGPLQGPAEQWAEELADLALTEGVSAFILASDDPDDLRRFAAEVAPATRELVAAER